MYLTRRMQFKRQDETFLSAMEPGEGDSIKTLVEILNCRIPKVVCVCREYTIISTAESVDAVQDIVFSVRQFKLAAFGKVNDTYFVAVPYNRERLIKNLIRSSKKFREVYRGVRLILDESDLLNVPVEFPKDRAYKDDE